MGAPNIKDTDVAKKARRLAKLKGTSTTAAVSEAFALAWRTPSTRPSSTVTRASAESMRRLRVFVHPFHLTLRPTKKL
jgi:hypothetical protein